MSDADGDELSAEELEKIKMLCTHAVAFAQLDYGVASRAALARIGFMGEDAWFAMMMIFAASVADRTKDTFDPVPAWAPSSVRIVVAFVRCARNGDGETAADLFNASTDEDIIAAGILLCSCAGRYLPQPVRLSMS